MKSWLRLIGVILLGFPSLCLAAMQLQVNIGPSYSVNTLASGIITFMVDTIGAICGGLFLVGALMIVTSGGGNRLEQGKGLIIGSLIGLVVVLGAYAIVRTVFHFIYA